jgi:cellulose synthase/poly-beta-1,6-N-acetylglucosamine synthase-like glycosyltransferase
LVVLVVADNCTDRTAAVAAAAGARVVERFDADRRSKGYAIRYVLEKLDRSGDLDSLDGLVFIDADTTIDKDVLRACDQALCGGSDWTQCYYTVANPDESWRTRLLVYAFALFNGVMLLGQNALGQSAGFRGNGMCLSVRGLRRMPWESHGLVEDMEYSWTLRIAGEIIAFEPGGVVRGMMVGSGGPAASNQRRRWEFGRREIRKAFFGRLLRSKRLGWGEKIVSACELTMPSMGVLLVVYFLVTVLDVLALSVPVLRMHHAERMSLLAGANFLTLTVCLYAVSPFVAMRLPWRYLSGLALFPLYVLWKFVVSLGGRPAEWVRTARESRTGGLS